LVVMVDISRIFVQRYKVKSEAWKLNSRMM